jgi:hypothetical protein
MNDIDPLTVGVHREMSRVGTTGGIQFLNFSYSTRRAIIRMRPYGIAGIIGRVHLSTVGANSHTMDASRTVVR